MQSLQSFITNWKTKYESRLTAVPLFTPSKVASMSERQIDFFVRAFQHARGHFGQFLWHLGVTAPSPGPYKGIIVSNIAEEFGGGDDISHEDMYIEFAEYMGVDIRDEILTRRTYMLGLREFNEGHLRFLRTNRWAAQWAAYSAYEKLDNVDYEFLHEVASVLAPEGPLRFFEVHRKVTHFEATESLLLELWEQDPLPVVDGFSFIGQHQFQMWKKLSNTVFGL